MVSVMFGCQPDVLRLKKRTQTHALEMAWTRQGPAHAGGPAACRLAVSAWAGILNCRLAFEQILTRSRCGTDIHLDSGYYRKKCKKGKGDMHRSKSGLLDKLILSAKLADEEQYEPVGMVGPLYTSCCTKVSVVFRG